LGDNRSELGDFDTLSECVKFFECFEGRFGGRRRDRVGRLARLNEESNEFRGLVAEFDLERSNRTSKVEKRDESGDE